MSQRRCLGLAIATACLVGGVLLSQQSTPPASVRAGVPPAVQPTFPPLPKERPTYLPQTPQPLQGLPAINPTLPGHIPAFTTQDMLDWVFSRRPPGTSQATRSPGGLLMSDCSLDAVQVSAMLDGQSVGVPASTPVCMVEVVGNPVFAFDVVYPPTYGGTTNYAYEVFNAVTGNLLMDGGLQEPFPTPTP